MRLDKEDKSFVIHMAALSVGLNIHLSRETQIVSLNTEKSPFITNTLITLISFFQILRRSCSSPQISKIVLLT